MALPETTPVFGHNRPPIERPNADQLREELMASAAPLYARKKELLESATAVPLVIEDEETAKELADLLGMFRACLKTAKGQFELEKQPWLDAGRTVDGVFTAGLIAPLEKMGKTLRERELAYIDAKAQAEKRRRLEEARKAQEEADRKLAEAQEAERKRLAAIAEAEAKAKADREEEARKAALTANPNAEPMPPPEPPAPLPAPSLEPVAKPLDEAIAAQQRADELKRQAEAKPAEMGRVRGDRGGVSTIRKLWTGNVTDRETLDLEALRPYLPQEALEQAVRAFAKTNGVDGKPAPMLRGANIFQKNV